MAKEILFNTSEDDQGQSNGSKLSRISFLIVPSVGHLAGQSSDEWRGSGNPHSP